MGIVAAILAVLCLCLLVKDLVYMQNFKSLEKQIKYLTSHDTNAELTVEAPDKRMEEIFRSMNQLLRATRNKQITYLNKERDLRKQMSNISHDLRTPLTSILGYIALAKDDSLPEQERKEYLEIVERRAKVLQELITGVYDLSRLEEERYLLDHKPIKINQLLYDVLALYYNEFENGNYVPDIQIPEQMPEVIGDQKAMLRIYSNLMQNVLRHGAHMLRVIVKVEADQIITLVENDSEEMEKEEVEKVFDRFYMADRIRTGENTGLGLAIVKSLAEHMGGRVEAVYEKEMFGIQIVWPIKKA